MSTYWSTPQSPPPTHTHTLAGEMGDGDLHHNCILQKMIQHSLCIFMRLRIELTHETTVGGRPGYASHGLKGQEPNERIHRLTGW